MTVDPRTASAGEYAKAKAELLRAAYHRTAAPVAQPASPAAEAPTEDELDAAGGSRTTSTPAPAAPRPANARTATPADHAAAMKALVPDYRRRF